jgi:hypothetical protein
MTLKERKDKEVAELNGILEQKKSMIDSLQKIQAIIERKQGSIFILEQLIAEETPSDKMPITPIAEANATGSPQS